MGDAAKATGATPMDDRSDVEALALAGRGDEQAFATLVHRHGAYLYGVARSLVRDSHEAEDVVQETFAAILSQRYRGEAAVRTWLVSIAVRQAALLRRKRRTWLRLWHSDAAAEAAIPATASEQAAVDARHDLTVMLARLSPEHREVIVLRELEGMSYDQIAQVLELPRGTVESRLHRARQQLRDALTQDALPGA
jgi:RNA polymerase sigma-70 factor (ECF subfamily)